MTHIRRLWPGFCLAILTACAALAAPAAAESIGPETAPTASAPVRILRLAQGGSNESCVAACRNAYNQCRMATKDSPACAARQDACLRACLSRR